jgi:TolB-like protein/DNA-binding winged helix-turn-helix (wHTH) protein
MAGSAAADDVPVTDGCGASGLYLFGPFSLDPIRRTLTLEGRNLGPPPRIFDVLLCLLENAGRTVNREELARAAWGCRVVEDGAIRQTIYALRKVLEQGGGPPVIATVPQRGYRLSVPVQRVPSLDPAPGSHDGGPGRGGQFAGRMRRGMLLALAPAAAMAVVMSLILPSRHGPAAEAPPHSVAVLPFTLAGHETRQDDVADGISAELIDALSRVDGLRVSARTSSFLFRNRPLPVTEVARQLNVGAILEGSIVRDGARLRLVAGLVDARSGFTLWSHSYDIDTRNRLDAQVDIAEAVAASLQGVFGTRRRTDFALGGTRNPAAYDAYLRGLKYARDADGNDARQSARQAFEAAIALDPDFAMARAWRARELAALYDESGNATPAQSQPLLRQAADEAARALAITPELGIAHLARAEIAKEQQKFSEAEREISLARDYAPNDIRVLTESVYMEVEFRHPGAALKAADLGVGLDPLSPSAYAALGYAQQALHDFDGALASLRHARLLGADTAEIAMIEAIIAFERSDNLAAKQDCARGPSGWMGELCLAVAEYRLGHAAQATGHFAALRKALGDNGAFQYAEVYAQWRRSADALKWLDVAYRTHDAGLAMMKTDTFLEPIRQTPQFAAIEKELRFPP